MSDHTDIMEATLGAASQLAGSWPNPPSPDPEDPRDETLLRLLDDRGLSPAERATLELQIEASPHARERLATLREALDEVAEVAPSPAPAQDAVATHATAAGDGLLSTRPRPLRLAFAWMEDQLRYLWGTLEPQTLAAVPVATRGEAAPRLEEETAYFEFASRFADVDVSIQVERDPDSRLDVGVSFVGPRATVENLRVTLTDERGSLLDSQPVEGNCTRFQGLRPQLHHLTISCAGDELAQVVLDIRKP